MFKAAVKFACILIMPALCACATLTPVEPVPQPTPQSLLNHFPKWERVQQLERLAPSFSGYAIAAADVSVMREWGQLYHNYANADKLAKLNAVNRFFNKWPYTEDRDIWRIEDYWATPAEFIEHSGDCEDFAIAKFFALKALGVPTQDMCIAAVWNRNRGEGHAVLLVRAANDDYYLLDNFSDEIKLRSRVYHYQPFFYLGENSMWLHKTP